MLALANSLSLLYTHYQKIKQYLRFIACASTPVNTLNCNHYNKIYKYGMQDRVVVINNYKIDVRGHVNCAWSIRV